MNHGLHLVPEPLEKHAFFFIRHALFNRTNTSAQTWTMHLACSANRNEPGFEITIRYEATKQIRRKKTGKAIVPRQKSRRIRKEKGGPYHAHGG